MNVVICKKGDTKIKYILLDCIKKGNNFIGSNKKISGIKLQHWDVYWTQDVPKSGADVSSINISNNTLEINRPTYSDVSNAIEYRKLIDNLSYNELDNYIETNVLDLASAKVFIKILAKVTLALCKLIDSK
jgi:hypothetical protein